MATLTKRPSGKWQATVRRVGRSASKSFTKRADAVKWARDAEMRAERGELHQPSRTLSRKMTLAGAWTNFAPGLTFYPRSGFMHVDLGSTRQWGERFPVRATAFAEEARPAREVLADSRTMKGGGAAGVATLSAAGVEVAQSVLAETQSAVLPLVPYLDTLRWVFIAVALGGVALTIYARLDDWKQGQR